MATANFFDRAAVAASQILNGFDDASFKAHLEKHLVAISFDDSATESTEARVSLELTVNLLSRLYPRIQLKPIGEKAALQTQILSELARSINPEMEFAPDVDSPSVCIIFGASKPSVASPMIFVGSDGWIAKISSEGPIGSQDSSNPFGAAVAACFGAASVFRLLFSEQLQKAELDSNLSVSLLDWDPSNVNPPNPRFGSVNLGDVHLVGVGAIGNAAVWVLSKAAGLKGNLHLIDRELIALSNLQRYILATQKDVDKSKVTHGADFLKPTQFKVFSHEQSWGEYLAARNDWNLERVAVAVDSAEDRRNIQAALPRRIINAWTQPGDIGVSRHSFLGDQACLTCLYFPKGTVKSEDQLVAESIGMPEALMEIRNSLYLGLTLTKEFLNRIATAKGINIAVLLRFENQPLRTLYVEGICGGAILELQKGVPSQQMEVPMNFQSVLAGIMLAAELVAQSGELSAPLPVTTKIDMLKSLGSYLSLPEPKRDGCICQDPDYINAYRNKYSLPISSD